MKIINKNLFQIIGPLAALALLICVLSINSPEFRTVNNAMTVLRQASINGLIAFGMTCVILTGAIDLSVGSVLGITAMFCAGMIRAGIPAPLAMLAAMLIGLILGVINGFWVAYGRLQPFIATLVTMTVLRGVTLLSSGGKPISNLGASTMLRNIGKGKLLGIPVPVVILIMTFFILWFLLDKTTFGRHIYALGSNAKAAGLAGVKIRKVQVAVYAVSGFLAALAGLILLSRLGSAQPTLGRGYEMDAIAATVLGGTSMSGGRGKIYGTMIGVLIIAILSNGLNILDVSSYVQDVVKGLVILVAVLADRNR